jgi:hypothetical protein
MVYARSNLFREGGTAMIFPKGRDWCSSGHHISSLTFVKLSNGDCIGITQILRRSDCI